MPIPLATILRPSKISDIVGQDHMTGPGKPIRMMVDKKKFSSVIFWGPPGIGKTTIISAMAAEAGVVLCCLNATKASVKDLRVIADAAKERLPQITFVFVDEIGRWASTQQAVLLPMVEDGTIVLFGATTENPKFAVSSSILSRCLQFELKPLDMQAMVNLIKRVKEHYKSQNLPIKIDRDAAERLIMQCSGDARKAITALETCIEILSDDRHVTLDHINAAIPHKHIVFDAKGNDHFDIAHCYQEAIQHSDVDGALYWLGKWIASGEDPAYICRRMLITAFEDCAGNSTAWIAAMAASYTVERTGLPECMIPMSLATCEMAKSARNKSAYTAIKSVMHDIENNEIIHVPKSMRAGTSGNVKVTNKVYLKSWVRDDQVERPERFAVHRQIMFAIGKEIDGEWAMSDGPNPNLQEMKSHGGSVGDCILRFECRDGGEPSTTVLFKWVNCDWEPVSI